MRILSIFLFCFFLYGCTITPNGARKREPILDLNTNKSVKDVSECIVEKWENNKYLFEYDNSVNIKTINNITTVYTFRNSIFADITSIDSGTNIKMFSATFGGMLLINDRKELLKQCL